MQMLCQLLLGYFELIGSRDCEDGGWTDVTSRRFPFNLHPLGVVSEAVLV